MSNLLYLHSGSPPSQLDLSRRAADRYAVLSALTQARADRRSRTGHSVRRLRRAVARYLVSTARLVDVS